MKLSVTSWSFPQCSFKESVGISSLLNINAIDISYFYRSALDKELLLQDHKKLLIKLINTKLIMQIYIIFLVIL